MAKTLNTPYFKPSVVTGTAVAATASSSAFSLPQGDCYQLYLNVTAATGTSPTMDVVLQTSFDGTNYLDLPIRWTQKTAAAFELVVFKLGLGGNEVALAQVAADTGGQLAKNCIFDPSHLKIKYTIGGTNPAFTFALHAAVLPSDLRSE